MTAWTPPEVAGWLPLGAVPPNALVPERLVLHHGVQLVAAVGRSLVPPRPDDGHTSLEWADDAFVGQPVPGARPWRAALRPSELTLVVDADGIEDSRFALTGHTRDEAFAWVLAGAERLGARPGQLKLEAPYAIPEHPTASGSPFPLVTAAVSELARWFADGNALVRAVASTWPDAAPVRVWPHHFDVGSVLPLDAVRGEESASIGIGLSPGDEGIAEPYLYATLWPAPDAQSLPALPAGGRWNREGWTGAVLTGSEIVAAGGAAAQASAAGSFLASAVAVLHDLHARRG
jgi:hypothetical protein